MFDWTSNFRFIVKWQSMMRRCYNVDDNAYSNYGGRGIKVCDAWHDPYVYVLQLPIGYFEKVHLDRIDNNGNYEPNNVRWVTAQDNHNNRRSSIPIEYKGKTQTLSQWSRELGLNRGFLHERIYILGWSIERAFETPSIGPIERMKHARKIRIAAIEETRPIVNGKRVSKRDTRKTERRWHVVNYNGKDMNIQELSAICGVSTKLLAKRIFERGWAVEKAVAPSRVR